MGLITMGFCSTKRRSDQGKNRTMVYLNVYDLTPANHYIYWLGVGIYHSGIEVHGMEYGYGAHDYPSSGVFEVEPRTCPGFIFRKSIVLGSTDMTRSEFRAFLEKLASKYHGNAYHLVAKNCNHFTDDVCVRLTGKHIPGWVNRLARLGSFLNCILPEHLQVSAVRQTPERPADDDEPGSAFDEVVNGEDNAVEEDVDRQRLLTPRNQEVSFVQEALVCNNRTK